MKILNAHIYLQHRRVEVLKGSNGTPVMEEGLKWKVPEPPDAVKYHNTRNEVTDGYAVRLSGDPGRNLDSRWFAFGVAAIRRGGD